MATESGLEAPGLTPPAAGGGGRGDGDRAPGATPGREPPDPRFAALDASAVGQPFLEALLRDDPTSLEFYQAVRLLERLSPGRRPVGTIDAHPRDEVARFVANPDFTFPASDIEALDRPGAGPARMQVNFMGMTGPNGILPLVYSSYVLERIRARDTALRDFLDLFNHRLVSLFYQAWERYRFVVGYERDRNDPVTRHLHDLLGIGTPGLRNRLEVPDEALLFYTGLLALPSRPAVALEQLLGDYFGVPVEVEQFVGGWYALDPSTRCNVGESLDASGQLGLGAVAGDEIWDQQSRVRIRLGPLTKRQYDQFLPTGEAYRALRALTRFYGGEQLDFEAQLVLARDEVPACTLGGDDAASIPLGWSTWVKNRSFTRDPDETILTL